MEDNIKLNDLLKKELISKYNQFSFLEFSVKPQSLVEYVRK